MRGIITLDHASGHPASLILGNDDFIRSRTANGLGVALLASARDDLQVCIHRSGGHRDVEIVGIVIDHNADPRGAMNSSGQQNIVPFRIALDHEHSVFKQFPIESVVRFNQHKGDFEPLELIDNRAANLSKAANDEMILDLLYGDVVDPPVVLQFS